MHGEHAFTWIGLIPVLNELPHHVVMTGVVIAALLVFGGLAVMRIRGSVPLDGTATIDQLVPESRLSLRNGFELVGEFIYGLTETVMGEHQAKLFFPVTACLFLFIFVANLFGLVPGFLPPTDNLNTTLALGIFVFLYYNYIGIREHGVGYFKHFFGPVAWLAPLMFVIEVASHLFRPLSLALRLRGNIMGDHVVLGVFSELVPVLLPVIFYGLGLFVAFVQAFVFCLLTMVYISLSSAHDH